MQQGDPPLVAARGRFLGKGMVAAIAVYLVVVLTWVQPRVSNDGLSYVGFLRRLLGLQPDGYAYQWGVGFWDLPWFLAAHAVGVLGVDEVSGLALEDVALTVAAVVAVLLLFPLGWLLLRDIGLDHAPWAILLTIFGTPLFYSVLFSPFDTHSVDALGGTAFAVLLLRAATAPVVSLRLALALGGLVGAMTTVRYANAALAVGVAVTLLARLAWRPMFAAAAAALVVGCILASIPALRGIPYGSTANPDSADTLGSLLQVDLLVPLKMLFSLQRGLFVWTPLTALSTVGFVLFWRRDPERRLFAVSLAAAGVAMLLTHVVWGKYWWGGMGFSARFLTGFFPLYLIGLAELMRIRAKLTTVLAIMCVAFSGFIALNRYYGYEGIAGRDGIGTIFGLYSSGEETPSEFIHDKLGYPVKERWEAYARLLSDR